MFGFKFVVTHYTKEGNCYWHSGFHTVMCHALTI